MDADGVIESYVHDVARRLPRDRRNDVAFELRALLADDVRSRADAEDRAADEALALDVVRGFGRPAETAARYHRPFTILEPSDTWSFVVAAVAGGVVAGLLTAPGPGTAGVPGATAEGAQRSTVATLAWLGLLVLGFAVKNLVLRRQPEAFAWRPRPVRDRDAASRAGNAAIAAGLAGFLVLYLTPGPVVEAVTGGRVAAADLRYTDSFAGPLRMPWLVVLLVVLIALHLYVAARGRWRPLTRWARLVVATSAATQLGWHSRYGQVFENPDADRPALWVAASAAGVLMVLCGVELYRELTRVDPAPAAEPRPNHLVA
jgi:hypothetical protein